MPRFELAPRSFAEGGVVFAHFEMKPRPPRLKLAPRLELALRCEEAAADFKTKPRPPKMDLAPRSSAERGAAADFETKPRPLRL